MESKKSLGNKLGYTTGTYAAAATKGALIRLLGLHDPEEIKIKLPDNSNALIPVNFLESQGSAVQCGVIKKSSESADATHDLEIFSQVSFREDDQIVIDGGCGIGRVTKIGLQTPIGEAAINPVPRKMICQSIRELTPKGVKVIISAPKGEEIAFKTSNSNLGILGGISIIGTTGIVHAKSLKAFKTTIFQQLAFCKKNNFTEVIITPGNISEKAMLRHFGDKIREDQIVQSGDFLGFTLKHVQKLKLPFLIAGHPGKLAKVLMGYFQTHYKQSPPPMNGVIPFLKNQIAETTLKEIKKSPTVEGIVTILQIHKEEAVLNNLAEAIEEKIKEYLGIQDPIPLFLFNMNKDLIGLSRAGKRWKEK